MSELRGRLQDANELFTREDVYQAFELLAEEYGFHRDERLPQRSQTVETASMTVAGFEHYPVLIVRPRTNRDSMITIPSLADRLLGDNMAPQSNSSTNAWVIATAKTVIVSPPGLVEEILNSTDPNAIKFLYAFAREYEKWMQDRSELSAQKKSGQPTGNERHSMSDPIST